MSKILLLYHWPYSLPNGTSPTLCFYDGLRIALQDAGYGVIEVNLANFSKSLKVGSGTLNVKNGYFQDLIKSLNPDLIISFNHCITEEVYLLTSCPVLVWDGDLPTSQWWFNTHLIKKYQERLFFFYTTQVNYQFYQKLWGISKNKCFFAKLATSCYAENKPVQRDICMIGSFGAVPSAFKNYDITNNKDRHILRQTFKEFLKVKDINTRHELINKLGIPYDSVYWYISHITRNNTVNSLMNDFEVELFGWTNIKNDPLLLCFNSEPAFSVSQISSIYNSSRIGLNINQSQQVCGSTQSKYSWRVCDIMATNACLVSSECDALKDDFGKWVSIPTFSNNFEAYNVCKKLLEEESFRNDIIAGSKLAIREGRFTFKDRVKEIEQIFNLKSDNINNASHEFIIDIKKNQMKACEKILINLLKKIYYVNLSSVLKKMGLDDFIKKLFNKFINQ